MLVWLRVQWYEIIGSDLFSFRFFQFFLQVFVQRGQYCSKEIFYLFLLDIYLFLKILFLILVVFLLLLSFFSVVYWFFVVLLLFVSVMIGMLFMKIWRDFGLILFIFLVFCCSQFLMVGCFVIELVLFVERMFLVFLFY